MQIKYHKQAEKFLAKQESKTAARIISAINKLPVGDVRKIEGYKDRYRLRVGSYRVVFFTKFIIDKETKQQVRVINVWEIDNRGDIY